MKELIALIKRLLMQEAETLNQIGDTQEGIEER